MLFTLGGSWGWVLVQGGLLRVWLIWWHLQHKSSSIFRFRRKSHQMLAQRPFLRSRLSVFGTIYVLPGKLEHFDGFRAADVVLCACCYNVGRHAVDASGSVSWLSSLCACQIALVMARYWFCQGDLVQRSCQGDVFFLELAQRSWQEICHRHLAKWSLVETLYTNLLQRSCQEISDRKLVQRSCQEY